MEFTQVLIKFVVRDGHLGYAPCPNAALNSFGDKGPTVFLPRVIGRGGNSFVLLIRHKERIPNFHLFPWVIARNKFGCGWWNCNVLFNGVHTSSRSLL